MTNRMLQERVLRDLQAGLSSLAEAQREAATGRRVATMSDDPVAGVLVMQVDRNLRGLEQYRRNVTSVRTKLDAEEAALDQVGTLLSRARELGVEQATATATPQTRAAAAAEVDRILDQVISLANTRVGREFVFGGTATAAPPFQGTTYVGNGTAQRAEISAGTLVDVNHPGDQVFVSSGVLGSLQALSTALKTGSGPAVGGTLQAVADAFDAVQVVLADTGARLRQLDVAGANMDALQSSYELQRSEAVEVPLEQAATRFLGLQNALQAALATASRVLNTSLAEYLR